MTPRLNPNASPPFRAWQIGPYGYWGVQCAQGWNCYEVAGGKVLTTTRERAEAAIRVAGHEPAEPIEEGRR